MSKRFAYIFIVGIVAMTICGFADMTSAHPGIGDQAGQTATLKDQLEAGLKARRPQEFAFIARIVTLVEEKKLSVEMVVGMYRWSRRKSNFAPFPYFERGIRQRAAKIGVQI